MHGTDFGGQVDYVKPKKEKENLENGPEPPPHEMKDLNVILESEDEEEEKQSQEEEEQEEVKKEPEEKKASDAED